VQFGSPHLEPTRLYYGDNLQVLRTLDSNSIDLIYIDPPFFSCAEYNVIWGDPRFAGRFARTASPAGPRPPGMASAWPTDPPWRRSVGLPMLEAATTRPRWCAYAGSPLPGSYNSSTCWGLPPKKSIRASLTPGERLP